MYDWNNSDGDGSKQREFLATLSQYGPADIRTAHALETWGRRITKGGFTKGLPWFVGNRDNR